MERKRLKKEEEEDILRESCNRLLDRVTTETVLKGYRDIKYTPANKTIGIVASEYRESLHIRIEIEKEDILKTIRFKIRSKIKTNIF